MSYASVANIEAEFKDVDFSATGATVSTSEVTEFLEDADAEIDAILSVKYQVPITGVSSLRILKMIATWMVKDRILNILDVKGGNPRVEQAGESGKTYRELAMEMLTNFASGKALLHDATLASSHDGVKSYVSSNSVPHLFERDTKQW